MKKLVLVITALVSSIAYAHVPKFPLEHQLVEMYLDVDVDVNRIYMQKFGEEYVRWMASVNDCTETKQDAMYIARISHMMGQVAISYHYGN